MRPYFYAALLFAATPALAQSPVITRADMPAVTAARPVDSLRLSVAAPVLPAGAPALTQRGPNQSWNYSSLTPVSQRVESYGAVPATITYQFSFGVLGGANRATVAAAQNLPLPAGFPLPITDPYQFFSVSAAGVTPSVYKSVGFGGTLGGLAVPVTYRSAAEQDIIYRFPLSYASLPDSSNSYFEINVPGAGFLSQRRKRVNRPDAWGTLTTPFGTFQTVRVVTRLEDHDSIAVTGINQGFDIPTQRQYKWLAVGQHVPLLTITTTELAGSQTITSVEYRDTYRRISFPNATRSAALQAGLAAYPNPSAVGTALTLAVPAGSGPLTVSATDLAGQRLFSCSYGGSAGSVSVAAEAFGSFRGVALLTVTTAQGTATRRVVRE